MFKSVCFSTGSDKEDNVFEQELWEYMLAHDGDPEDRYSNTEKDSIPLSCVQIQLRIRAPAKLILLENDAPTSSRRSITRTEKTLRKD